MILFDHESRPDLEVLTGAPSAFPVVAAVAERTRPTARRAVEARYVSVSARLAAILGRPDGATDAEWEITDALVRSRNDQNVYCFIH